MKDLIAKLQMDATCAMGAIWMHIDAQAARIAELEAQIAAASAPADTDKLREAWTKDAEEFGDALNEAGWEFIDKAPQGGMPPILFNNLKPALRAAILKYAEKVASSTALQAPVREVTEGMPASQDPKYGIRDNRLFNRASGETIPEDEPVFIFRARDTHAVNILAGYAREVLNAEHASAVWSRVDDFKRFWDANPDRMKQPDTALPSAADAKDAERWRFRQKFLLDGGAVLWSQRGCQYRDSQGAIICQGGTEEEAIDAAIQAQKDGA